MKICSICKRETENLGIRIKTVWCEAAKNYICKGCCIKNNGKKCHWWCLCWEVI